MILIFVEILLFYVHALWPMVLTAWLIVRYIAGLGDISLEASFLMLIDVRIRIRTRSRFRELSKEKGRHVSIGKRFRMADTPSY